MSRASTMSSGTADQEVFYRIGLPAYPELIPIRVELQKHNCFTVLTYSEATLARMLHEGSIDLAPCSAVRLIDQPSFDLAMPAGLVLRQSERVCFAFRDGWSHYRPVYEERVSRVGALIRGCEHQDPKVWAAQLLQELRCLDTVVGPLGAPTMGFVSESLSDSSLGRVLYSLLFGLPAHEINERLRGQHDHLDVGAQDIVFESVQHRREGADHRVFLPGLWQTLTGMPFVAEVWQGKPRQQLQAAKTKFFGLCELAQMTMRTEPSSYWGDSQNWEALSHAWRHAAYKLSEVEMKSLLFFLSLASLLADEPSHHENLRIKVMRWQERVFKN